MSPVVMHVRVLAILSDADIPERRLTCELDLLQDGRDTINVSDDFTRGTPHSTPVFLKGRKGNKMKLEKKNTH